MCLSVSLCVSLCDIYHCCLCLQVSSPWERRASTEPHPPHCRRPCPATRRERGSRRCTPATLSVTTARLTGRNSAARWCRPDGPPPTPGVLPPPHPPRPGRGQTPSDNPRPQSSLRTTMAERTGKVPSGPPSLRLDLTELPATPERLPDVPIETRCLPAGQCPAHLSLLPPPSSSSG